MVEAAQTFTQLFCKRGASPAMKSWLASFCPRGGVRMCTPIRTETAICTKPIFVCLAQGSIVWQLTSFDKWTYLAQIVFFRAVCLFVCFCCVYLVQHSIWWYIVRHIPQQETLAVLERYTQAFRWDYTEDIQDLRYLVENELYRQTSIHRVLDIGVLT